MTIDMTGRGSVTLDDLLAETRRGTSEVLVTRSQADGIYTALQHQVCRSATPDDQRFKGSMHGLRITPVEA